MDRKYSDQEWQQILAEHVKHGCDTTVTLRVLRCGRFPKLQNLSRKGLDDYLMSNEGAQRLQTVLAAHEAQVQANLDAMAARRNQALEDMSLYELWEELTKDTLKRALGGDREAAQDVHPVVACWPACPQGRPARGRGPAS